MPNSVAILSWRVSQIIKLSSMDIKSKLKSLNIRAALCKLFNVPSEAELLKIWQKNIGISESKISIENPNLISCLK